MVFGVRYVILRKKSQGMKFILSLSGVAQFLRTGFWKVFQHAGDAIIDKLPQQNEFACRHLIVTIGCYPVVLIVDDVWWDCLVLCCNKSPEVVLGRINEVAKNFLLTPFFRAGFGLKYSLVDEL